MMIRMRNVVRIAFVLLLAWSTLQRVESQYYISANGDDHNIGSRDNPFATLEKTLEIVKSERDAGDSSPVEIFLQEGKYMIAKTIEFTAGTSNISIAACSGEEVTLSGSRSIPVEYIMASGDDEPGNNPGNYFKVNLKQAGITDYGQIRSVGFARPYGASWGEIFVNGKPMHLARWPNTGMIPMGAVEDPGSVPRNNDFSKRGGVFKYDSARISGWEQTGDIWISGYFMHGYADDAVKVAEIDTTNRIIRTAQPTLYGFGHGKPWNNWYAFNVHEEMDAPGEYYIDHQKGVLYFITSEEKIESLEFSVLEDPFIALEGTSNITIRGITFECSRGLGISMDNTTNVRVEGCTFRNMGSLGVTIGKGIEPFADYRHEGTGRSKARILGSLSQHLYANPAFKREGGQQNAIINCEFFQLGAGGVSLGGGDRITLEPGNNVVENCIFHDINRIEKSYRPAVHLTGVGNKIVHCEIFNTPSMAILMHGNNHLVEYNNIHDVCLEVDDQGAFYYGRDPSERGTIIRYNYFHHIPDQFSTCAIYLDDGACGLSVTDNIFYKAGKYAMLMGGGSDNTCQNNIFIEGKFGIHIDNRLENWSSWAVQPGELFEKRLQVVSYSSPPYITQYPEFDTYWNNPALPSNNLFENNIFYNINKTIQGKKEWLDFKDTNWETQEDPGFADMENHNFFLWNKSVAYEKIKGFRQIPFNKIGLYETSSARKTIRGRNGLLMPVNENNIHQWEELQKVKESYKVKDQDVIQIVNRIIIDTASTIYPNPHSEAQWFGDGQFGLFMHWGPHSVNGSQPSWAMIKHYPYGYETKYDDPQNYFDLDQKFDPANWNPDTLCKVAKEAGMTYIVLTTKHHDGFALWPTKFGNYNAGTSKAERDLLEPYVEACRKYGLKVGFYFSQRDWHFPEYPVFDENFNRRCRGQYPIFDTALDSVRYYNWFTYTIGQINELLTNYGQIDILWFDGFLWPGANKRHYTEALYNWIRSLQPGIICNDRWYRLRNPDNVAETTGTGDFATIEWKEPDTGINKWWEFNTSWCGSWGYSKLRFDDKEALRLLIKARSLGGNFLLNIGPSPEGNPPEGFYPYMEQLAKWIKPNREALLGKGFTVCDRNLSNVMVTQKGDTLYLHLLPGSKHKTVELRGKLNIHKMHLLASGKKIKFTEKDDDKYQISLKKNKINTGDYQVLVVSIDLL